MSTPINDNIPSITIGVSTASLSSAEDSALFSPLSAVSPSQNLSPTDDGFLSPHSAGVSRRTSLDVPGISTPADISSNDGSLTAPPSPTLSNQSSVHFNTTLALRDNKPETRSGLSSLGLLSPADPFSSKTHHRKGSNTTFASSSDGTESDHRSDVGLRYVKSNATSVTHVEPSRMKRDTPDSDIPTSVSETRKKRALTKQEISQHARDELSQDIDIDCTPFAFKPHILAQMLDPKNLELLESLGGRRGLLIGLGTNPIRGLGKQSLMTATTHHAGEHRGPEDGRPGATGTGPPDHDSEENHAAQPTPSIVTTAPEGQAEKPAQDDDGDEDGPAFSAPLNERRRIYGENVLAHRPSKTLLHLMGTAMKDKVLILLAIAAVVSLALGFFQDFGTTRPPGQPPVDWVEGVAIMVAIFIVVIVGSLNDWQKERQFKALNEKGEERGVKVIRDGVERVIDVKEVVVGDIALLEPGEVVPCDGVFLSGHNVKCDESGATGESDAIKKVSFEECLAIRQKRQESQSKSAGHTDCFVVSGSKVLEGVGSYVVVAVGAKSFNGRIMMALRGDTENTPLQMKLNRLAELIAKIGSLAGLMLFSALMIKYFIQIGTNNPPRSPNAKGIAFVNILIISVTLVVVAVPEGLPLAVTLALAFATKRMTYEKLLVRVLGSCETMANASVVCTDKTGTLTQNVMTVVAGSVGIHAKFVRHLKDNPARTNADQASPDIRRHCDDFSIDQTELNTVLSPQLRDLFNAAIAVNSTAFQDTDPNTDELVFVGSKTETALLTFAKELGWADFKTTRDSARVVQMIAFSSERKAMGVVIKLSGVKWRFYLKGASEILSKKCTRHVVVHRDGGDGGVQGADVETALIDDLARDNITRTIIFYANQTLRTIALCYRDFDAWPPEDMVHDDQNEVAYDDLAQDLTLIGITGIEDPLRKGVREAVSKCHKAGVAVKMCTGDNALTARSIAQQCGIFTAGGIIMEGPVFRQLSKSDMIEVVPRLQVLARSSPEDKKTLVGILKSTGEIVGVTGDGTNDGPALKTAHVGFSMGISGTEVAKEASDIILMDDNFSSIVKAIMWGRCVNDAVRKFLQFQISTNVTAVVITFVSAVASVNESSVLSAVQLLWINIIMDTFAALALATDPASEALLDRKPDRNTAPLFSVNMYKQIMFQSIYQIIITLLFHFLGLRILGFSDNSNHNDVVLQTLVFNAFVFAQIFNSVNCRRLDRKLNIFEGLTRNWYFIAITLIEIVVQVLIVFIGQSAFQVTRLGAREWGISLALGVVSIPLGALVRLIPNGPFEKLFTAAGLLGKSETLPTVSPESEGWNNAITLVRDNLKTFANLRGGRVRSSSFVINSRSARVSNDHQPSMRLSSLLTMAPTLMASTIGAGGGWVPETGSLSDPARHDPSKSSAALWEGKLQLHPDTPKDDPAYIQFGGGVNSV